MSTLAALLEDTPYVSYAYAYPHKSAYRRLRPAVPLADAWAGERRDALFLYVHVPFCEMRCGFCNLFTTADPRGLDAVYLDALAREAFAVRDALGRATFARMAIGGGTPTYLDMAGLHRLFDLAEQTFGVDAHAIPVSVETSPHTATPERLRALRSRGADRISIGVQSFLDREAHAAGRPQCTAEVHAALGRIRAANFPILNVDLIYGLPGQTEASWLQSIDAALQYAPEELYLYPLYVRPLTGLDRTRTGASLKDHRLPLYRAGRERLLAAGYAQVSMRMFRAPHAPAEDGPVYCCQEDGMVGLGCGARSYTRALHYSSEYAVGASGVRAILADYAARPKKGFATIEHGYRLDGEDQRRRYVIQSLLQRPGLDCAAYAARFGSAVDDDLPQLGELVALGLAERGPATLRLNARGLERSDAIGPWLYSAAVRRLSEEYTLR